MKSRLLKIALPISLILSSCGQQITDSREEANNPSAISYWTKADLDKVKDLSELGDLTVKDNVLMVGGKSIHPEDLTGQQYTVKSQLMTQQDTVIGSTTVSKDIASCFSNMLLYGTINARVSTQPDTYNAIYAAASGQIYERSNMYPSGDRLIGTVYLQQTTKGYPTQGIVATGSAQATCADMVGYYYTYYATGWHKIVFKTGGVENPITRTSSSL